MLHRASRDLGVDAVDHSLWRHVDAVLSSIQEITEEASSDEELHLRLARALANALGCHTAFVGQLVTGAEEERVRTRAVWSRGRSIENFEYALAGTPCEEVVRAGLLSVEREVAKRFPDDKMLRSIDAESYLGVVLRGPDGKPTGHIAALDDQPIRASDSSKAILQIFASRAESNLDRRTVESRLKHVEDNFRLLFDHSPNPIILFDPDTWQAVEFNDLAASFMGYTREEFEVLTITDFEFDPNPEETREHVAAILESGGDIFEALHRAKDGSPRHVIVSLRMTVWSGKKVMLTLWHDITRRKAAEQALEASERRHQGLFDSAMDAIVIVDQDLKIRRLNPAAERILKCPQSELSGQDVHDFFPGKMLKRLFRRVGEGEGDSGSMWAPHGLNARSQDGVLFPVELTLSQFESDGESFFTLIVRDVNDRRQAEREIRRLQEDKRLLQEQVSQNATIVGESPAMAGVFSHVEKVAATDSTVLILGETGTGKELIAMAIHQRSVRRDRVMVNVNCAALPTDLLESELFGHEKGAFTGATQRKRGRFELANGGTLFLDEVGELSAEAQAKLLRALQEGEVQRVGGESTVRVNVRVIAATNRDLLDGVKEGRFRNDLYYRLSVFPLRLPPLRERRTDIRLLVDHFVDVFSRRFGKTFDGFDASSMRRLESYDWPGNVRELQNVIERAAILSNGPELTVEPGLLRNPAGGAEGSDDLADATREHLRRVLADCDWVIEGPNGAAIRLGIKPSTLRFRMNKLGIKKP